MAVISVIIPAYNAEHSLERTVRSVLAQTFRDLEVWIVDDGSMDGTPALADSLAAEDQRVKVIHQANQRAYAARINALNRSVSRYVAFVDADDALEPTMYEKMIGLAEAHDLDVVQCGVFGREKEGPPELYLTKDEVRRCYAEPYLIEGRSAAFVWDKIYSRRVCAGTFESSNILMFEDLKINLQVFDKVERMGILHEGLYHYDINPGSSVSNFKPRNVDDLREMIETRARLAPRYGVSAGDPRLDCWIVKNVRNFLISACVAKAESFRVRLQNVRLVLAIPELDVARRHLKWTHAKGLAFVAFCNAVPLSVAVFMVRLLKQIQRKI